MSGHTVLVKRDSDRGWFARCTSFGCGWAATNPVTKALAQKLADAHEQATA